MEKNKATNNRRKVLKAMGSSSIALTGIPASVSASTPQFRGIAYDTLTHEAIGTVRGNINKTNNGYKGAINIAGFSLPLEKLEFASQNPDEKHTATLDDKKFRNDDIPLKLVMSEHSVPNEHYSGTLTRPSGEFGRIGYFLTSNPDVNAEEMVEQKTKRTDLVNGISTASVPNKGIPKETGSTHLLKQLGDNR